MAAPEGMPVELLLLLLLQGDRDWRVARPRPVARPTVSAGRCCLVRAWLMRHYRTSAGPPALSGMRHPSSTSRSVLCHPPLPGCRVPEDCPEEVCDIMARCLDGNPHARPSAIALVQLLQQAPGVPPGGVAMAQQPSIESSTVPAKVLDTPGGEPSGQPPRAPSLPAPQQQILRQTTDEIDVQQQFSSSLTASWPSSPVVDASRAVRQGISRQASLEQRLGMNAFTQAMTGAPLPSPFSNHLARQESIPTP